MSSAGALTTAVAAPPPRLLDQLWQNALICFGRPEPAARHVEWVRRFILFHGKRHPRDLGINDVGQFLQHLAQSEKDPLSGIEQARETLEFLYACGLAGGVVCVCVDVCNANHFGSQPWGGNAFSPRVCLVLSSGVLP
jgi:hypothetical protein